MLSACLCYDGEILLDRATDAAISEIEPFFGGLPTLIDSQGSLDVGGFHQISVDMIR